MNILLNKCKDEAARALEYLHRKGSSYNDAVNNYKINFTMKKWRFSFCLMSSTRLQASENASQLRTIVNDIIAIISRLSHSENRIDAREYKSKILTQESIKAKLVKNFRRPYSGISSQKNTRIPIHGQWKPLWQKFLKDSKNMKSRKSALPRKRFSQQQFCATKRKFIIVSIIQMRSKQWNSDN